MSLRLMRFHSILGLTAVALLLAASAPARAQGQKDIVDVAVAAGSFKTLVAAVQAANLVEVLKRPGPLTVLAPTDEAFAKIPKADLDALTLRTYDGLGLDVRGVMQRSDLLPRDGKSQHAFCIDVDMKYEDVSWLIT